MGRCFSIVVHKVSEAYLFYSSLMLFGMSCLTLILAVVFRLKHRSLNKLPKNLSVTVFNKTFNVFNPYSEQRKVIHSFLSALPLIVLFILMVLFFVLLKILQSSLLLSLILLIICLNLMLVDVASDIYHNAKIFTRAIRTETSFGVGDLNILQMLKKAMPKLSNYYLSLSILFLLSATTLNYVWSSLLWFLASSIGLMIGVSTPTSFMSYLVAVFIFAVVIGVIQILAWKIKGKILTYIIGVKSKVL